MLTSKKKFFSIFFIICFLFLFSSVSKAIVPQTREFYVNDRANIINSDTEDYIISVNKQLYDKTGAQIVVVTVNNLEEKSVEDYATELFRSYGIGSKEKNNGVLFIVSLEERKTRIEVGYGLEGRLNDGKCGRILDDYVIPYFKDNNWNDGISNGFNAILDEVCQEYDIKIDGANTAVNIADANEREEDIQYITGFIVFVICLITRHIFSSNILVKWGVAFRNWSWCNYC